MRWFFYHSIVSKIENKEFNFFVDFCLTLAAFSVFGRVRQDFSTTWEDFAGSIFQPFHMASHIRDLRGQNALKIFSLPNRKISLCAFSVCAK